MGEEGGPLWAGSAVHAVAQSPAAAPAFTPRPGLGSSPGTSIPPNCCFRTFQPFCPGPSSLLELLGGRPWLLTSSAGGSSWDSLGTPLTLPPPWVNKKVI